MTSLLTPETRIKVSSVLNRDNGNFGKQHLIDGNEETCWNSEQGTPQHIIVDFGSSVSIRSVVLTFQGGFVGKTCIAQGSLASSPNDYNVDLGSFYPEDINSTQTFDLKPNEPVQRLKIIFQESTDFYGRITLYKLDILG
ncbi:Nuclear receptor 2C2-associated protein [Apophysomyces ossiformis]|uniref:Nuclear receptor 2C2-associated protein n=1 Tax=Apophysomyces ossiformis TaxID=679940 RepID=A0A8H7BWM3_9FUNG|nr:Nuclear receptor 2C2-associated protein [Apophysomyces ossiformis]